MIDTPSPGRTSRATGKGARQTLGHSRGGLSTKIHQLADNLGRPPRARTEHDLASAPET
jgi:hypothetical protein